MHNVVLLTVDALRADHVSWYGYERETTPRFDELASESLCFQNAYSASSHTREAIPSLLTGAYPDIAVDDQYARAASTIASRLADTGYSRAGFHSNPFVSRGFGYDQGFDTFDDDLRWAHHRFLAFTQRVLDKLRNRHYAPGETINERSLAWLDDTDTPVFLWNHYMDPHGPYDAPAAYRGTYYEDSMGRREAQRLYRRAAVTDPESITDAERQQLVDCYDEEIRYTDACLGSFLDALADRGLREQTLVIVTADHGDAFGGHSYYGHPRHLHEELTRVPLLVCGPDVHAGSVDVPVSLLDLVPTILDVAGIDGSELPGTSLLEVAENPDAFADRRVFTQARGDGDERTLRRFTVETGADRYWLERDTETGEIRDERGENDDLRAALVEHSDQRLTDTASDADRSVADKDIQRRLEALGYKE